MKEGLLWYDDNPGRDMAEKIGRAARRYQQKFGVPANVCYVHPSALSDNGKIQKVGEMRVASKPSVLRHHFWLGRDEERAKKRQSSLAARVEATEQPMTPQGAADSDGVEHSEVIWR